jgi:uncharacterized membrane protein YhfC
MIALALWLGVFLTRKFRLDWRLYFVGAVTFVASQILHIPFNLAFLNPWVESVGFEGFGLIASSIALGLSAGIFEEVTRYVVYRFWIKRDRSWEQGLLFGAGHGGVEAIILGVLSLLTVIRIISLEGIDLQTVVPEGQLALAEAQIAAFWGAPWFLILLGAFERAIALAFHMSAALLVLQAFTRNNIAWLLAAIGWHALLDALAVFASQTWGPYVTEGILAVFAFVCLWLIKALRPEPVLEPEPDLGPPQMLRLKKENLTLENIEESRYE